MQPSNGSISPHLPLSFFSDSDDGEVISDQSSVPAVYEVESILDSRSTDTGIEYLIKKIAMAEMVIGWSWQITICKPQSSWRSLGRRKSRHK